MSTLNRTVFPDNYDVTGPDTVPRAVTLSGTFSTNNADASGGKLVTGVSTLFTTEILDTKVKQKKLKYKWLFDPATCMVRKIQYVLLDTSLMLFKPFPSSVAGGTAVKCPDSSIDPLEISVAIDPTGNAKVNGAVAAAGITKNWANDNGVEPIAIDGTGTTIEVLIKT